MVDIARGELVDAASRPVPMLTAKDGLPGAVCFVAGRDGLLDDLLRSAIGSADFATI